MSDPIELSITDTRCVHPLPRAGCVLFGLEPSDPATLVAAAVVRAAVGLTAGWVPAFRASRVSPMDSLGRH